MTWKCHNEDWLLSSNYAKKLYYSLLLKYKNLYQIQIFSYCLMDNHPHIVGTCKSQQLFSDFFRVVNSLFAKKMNRYLDRKGQVVMDRFKSINIKTEKQLMAVMFYNDLNPFRTIKQTSPEAHQWSSHKHYAYGKKDPLITEAEWYLELGDSETKRQKRYRALTKDAMQSKKHSSSPYKIKNKWHYFLGDKPWIKKSYEHIKIYLKERKNIQQNHRIFLEKQSLAYGIP
ncbi:MAG: transposase [Deltaproteobacteria bacterium]|nr:transposase [Deltaproteobacteria bacterium]